MTSPVSIPAGTKLLDDHFDAYEALTSAWVDWTSSFTWTATVTNPVLGNGTKEARYVRAGKLVIATASILTGSTTTYGSGTYVFSVPFAASTTELYAGSANLIDQGTAGNRQPGSTRFNTVNDIVLHGNAGPISPTSPFTWATGDRIQFLLVYEAA